jgi:hypothetical protein
MTKDEFREYVRTQIAQVVKQPDVIDGAVNRITNQWEEDVEYAIESTARESSDADACNGPCCGGPMYPDYSDYEDEANAS